MAVAPEVRPSRLAAEESETAEQLFAEHSGWIYGYCLRVLRSPEEAEDALQTTYLNACRSLNQGTRPKRGSAWLLRIAQNVCLSRLRSSGRRSTFEQAQDTAVLEATAPAPDREQDDLVGLTEALHGMPEQQRRAILLREWQGLSYREIAAELELTQSAVETLIFRARRSLAAGLESPAKRSRLRSLYTLDLGGLAAAIKGLLAGSTGVKVAALAVAAATTTTIVATDPGGVLSDGHSVRQARTQPASSQAASERQPSVAEPVVEGSVLTALPEPRTTPPDQDSAPQGDEKAPGPGNGKAKANGQAEDHPGARGNSHGNGRAEAPGQVKKAENAPNAPSGDGSAHGGKPDHAGQSGPPPHAQAGGVEKAEKVKKAKK